MFDEPFMGMAASLVSDLHLMAPHLWYLIGLLRHGRPFLESDQHLIDMAAPLWYLVDMVALLWCLAPDGHGPFSLLSDRHGLLFRIGSASDRHGPLSGIKSIWTPFSCI